MKIGKDHPVFIIAEAGINHNGDLNTAKEMIVCAKECGASAVKFQTFTADDFVSDIKDTYSYVSNNKNITESMYEMFKRHEFLKEEWSELCECCKKNDITFLTTPQNPKDLDMILEITDLQMIKVGSDDLTNLDLLNYYTSKKKPMIISAGMAYMSEIEDAVLAIRRGGVNDIVVLHCISSYPADAEEVNLRKMETIANVFNVEVGFSDHTYGITATTAAVALGARVIEKHFTLDNSMEGPDHRFSCNPCELKELVNSIRYVEKALGGKGIFPTEKEMDMRKIARRSIVAKADIKQGEIIKSDLICYKRPGTGIPPKLKDFVINKRAMVDIKKNELITADKL